MLSMISTFALTKCFFGRFCDLVNSIAEEAWKGPEEGDCDSDALEVRGLKTRFTSMLAQVAAL